MLWKTGLVLICVIMVGLVSRPVLAEETPSIEVFTNMTNEIGKEFQKEQQAENVAYMANPANTDDSNAIITLKNNFLKTACSMLAKIGACAETPTVGKPQANNPSTPAAIIANTPGLAVAGVDCNKDEGAQKLCYNYVANNYYYCQGGNAQACKDNEAACTNGSSAFCDAVSTELKGVIQKEADAQSAFNSATNSYNQKNLELQKAAFEVSQSFNKVATNDQYVNGDELIRYNASTQKYDYYKLDSNRNPILPPYDSKDLTADDYKDFIQLQCGQNLADCPAYQQAVDKYNRIEVELNKLAADRKKTLQNYQAAQGAVQAIKNPDELPSAVRQTMIGVGSAVTGAGLAGGSTNRAFVKPNGSNQTDCSQAPAGQQESCQSQQRDWDQINSTCAGKSDSAYDSCVESESGKIGAARGELTAPVNTSVVLPTYGAYVGK